GLLIFNSCCGSSHDHTRRGDASQAVYIPWYQRVFSPIYAPSRGHEPHVPVGRGHIPPPPERNWYDGWLPFLPSDTREMNQGGAHVPVGRGHAPGGHVPVGGGHGPGGNVPQGRGGAPGGHVPVGGGHPPDPHGHGRGGPPAGPGGHVPIGRGRHN